MEWSNDKILEFLELLEMEPCLWNFRSNLHKNRAASRNAWRRIVDTISFKVTVDELKKKKESLMGYYRVHLNKYKQSLQSGDEVYNTSWFAYSVMDSFLRPMYENDSRTIESTSEKDDKETVFVQEVLVDNDSEESSDNEQPARNPLKKTFKRPRPQANETRTNETRTNETRTNKTRTNETRTSETRTNEGTSKTNTKDDLDECDHFAHMIASKIRRIENMDDREELMNSIQNLTYEVLMRNRRSSVANPKREK